MDKENITAESWFEEGTSLRRKGLFGEAINAFRAAEELAEKELVSAVSQQEKDALQDIIKKSLASVGLIQEINGFVNTDLMNP